MERNMKESSNHIDWYNKLNEGGNNIVEKVDAK